MEKQRKVLFAVGCEIPQNIPLGVEVYKIDKYDEQQIENDLLNDFVTPLTLWFYGTEEAKCAATAYFGIWVNSNDPYAFQSIFG
jgi:hypothetical protein